VGSGVVKIRITAGDVEVVAELDDSATGRAIAAALPLQGAVHRWGDEVYFEVPLHIEQAPDAREEMAIGELAFWPVGDAFCIFFGATPVSLAGEPRAYSPVNPFGMVAGDAEALRVTRDGDAVRVRRLEN
jgi:uncharacterized protein